MMSVRPMLSAADMGVMPVALLARGSAPALSSVFTTLDMTITDCPRQRRAPGVIPSFEVDRFVRDQRLHDLGRVVLYRPRQRGPARLVALVDPGTPILQERPQRFRVPALARPGYCVSEPLGLRFSPPPATTG